MDKSVYRGHRFPQTIIQLTVWMYGRFTLSLRDVEELLAERGLDISYETVRRWFLKFGQVYAAGLRQARHRPTDRWFLDEMVIAIARRKFYLWRAVDSEGEVLDFLIQRRRNTRAAERLMRKLLKKQGFAPSIIVTDKLRSYAAARKKLGLHAVHVQGRRQNNRCENSHLPVRRREHKQQRFKSPGSAQRFLNVHAAVYNLFNIDRHLTSRRTMKAFRDQAFRQWRHVTVAA
jgi:transposase-like protein